MLLENTTLGTKDEIVAGNSGVLAEDGSILLIRVRTEGYPQG